MANARKQIVEKDQVRSYHCMTRCVRRAFLCGFDCQSGKNFEHRRGWIRSRMVFLSRIFVLDVIGYSVQSNHIHIILRTRPDIAGNLSPQEIACRWLRLFPPPLFKGKADWTPSHEIIEPLTRDAERIECLRQRLNDLSWFMRCLDERIARMANQEDQCKGRFWEGRFKCKLLIDEAALLTCLAYVDLNPIRAGEAKTPEESWFTSACERIQAFRKAAQGQPHSPENPDMPPGITSAIQQETGGEPDWLCPLTDRFSRKGVFQKLDEKEYFDILDAVGREKSSTGKGSIPLELAPILERLSINVTCWTQSLDNYDSLFRRILGRASHIMAHAKASGLNWFQGIRICRILFGT